MNVVMMFFLFCFLLFQTDGNSATLPPQTTAPPEQSVQLEGSTEKPQEPELTIERKTGFGASTPELLFPLSTGVLAEGSIAARVGENLQQVLAGAVVGLTLTATDEQAGGGTSFALRMPFAYGSANQPLFILDGVPLMASQDGRRLADLVPADIASIDVLKGPSATAIYGARGTFGVVLVETRRGAEAKPKYSVRQSLGTTSVAKKLGSRRFTRESAVATYGQGVDTLWQAEFYDHESAIFQDEATALETLFSVQGGSGRTGYYLSGTSFGKSGIMAGTRYERDSLRLNLDHEFSDRIVLGLNLGLSKVAEPPVTNEDILFSLAATPSFIELAPNASGNYPDNPFNSLNAYQLRNFLAEEDHKAERSTASVKLAYQILSSAQSTLDVALVLGFDNADLRSSFDHSSTPYASSYGTIEHNRDQSTQLLLTHQGHTGRHQFRSRVGILYDSWRLESTVYRDLSSTSSETSHSVMNSRERGYFVEERFTGSWYLISAGLRADHSTRSVEGFGRDLNPWLNGALRLSQHEFWSPIKEWLPEFKLRTSWGRSKIGRVEIPLLVFAPGAKNEPDLHREWDMGLDAGFWSGRGSLALTFFNRKIEDLNVIQNPGDPDHVVLIDNARRTKVDGWEASLSLSPMRGEDWHWLARLDYYSLTARVTDLQGGPFNLGPLSTSLGAYRVEQGWSPTSIVGSNRDPAGNFLKLGDLTPDYQLTWHNEVQRSAWSLNWLLDMSKGGEAIELARLISDYAGTSPDLDQHPDRLQVWSEGDTRPWVLDSSFIRLREVSLAYTMSPSLLHDKLGHWLSHLEFALWGRNLKTWSDFVGYDPEQGSPGIGSTNYLHYPTSKSVYLSVTLGFPADE